MMQRLISVVVLAGCLAWPAAAAAQAPADPLHAAAAWMRTQQQPDGGFSNGFVPGSDAATTADAVLGIVAAGEDPSEWNAGGSSPMDLLRVAVSSGSVVGPGAFAKVTLAVVAAGDEPRDFGGVDLVGKILQGYSSDAGMFGGGPYDSALAIQALAAAGEPLPEGAIAGLLATRLADATYSFNGDQALGAGDSNTTAMAVMALIAAGERDDVAPSLAYFRSVQNEDGGWTYQKPSAFGEDTDANSTALVLQALAAAGEDLAAWNDPAQALLALQLPSGAFIFNAANSSENLLATVQALPALALVMPSEVTSAHPPWTVIGLVGIGVVIVGILVWRVLRKGRAGDSAGK
ncbi:MAG: cell wall anchor protein [Chloroflexi bacterium]|nr:cell wall anchor protein [Chloroflexota bacterium]